MSRTKKSKPGAGKANNAAPPADAAPAQPVAATEPQAADASAGAKKGKLKAAFGKAASGKLKNRVVLRKFTELIAA